MPAYYLKCTSKFIVAILFVCLLSFSLGAAIFPASAIQEAETSAPVTAIPSDPSLTGTPDPATPSPTEILPETINPDPTVIPTEVMEGSEGESYPPALPVIFKSGSYAQDELVVRFKPSASSKRVEECFQGLNVQVQSEIEELNTFILTDRSGELANTFYHLMDCRGVLYVEPNFLLQVTDTTPNDPFLSMQYGLERIRAPQGWDLSTGSPAVNIAIVDTGVDLSHPDLVSKLVAGYDFVNNDANPQDDHGHGTHVAGIAAASSNNGAGVAGVSWGAGIMPVKVLSAKGSGTNADTAAGVIWAVNHGAQVINLSLGGSEESTVLEDAINYAHSLGAVIVAASGNKGDNFVLYPARYPNVIAVARTNSADNWTASNYGREIDLAAPGVSIYSTTIGGYGYMDGTSMASGFVSGLAAVLMGIPGNNSPDLIKTQMESTAKDIESAGWDFYTGAGLIQMDAAILLALQSINLPPENGPRLFVGSGPSAGQAVITSTSPSTLPAYVTPSPQNTLIIDTPEPSSPAGASPTPTHTPSQQDEVEVQTDSEDRNFVLPCTGILLILLGILLLFMFKQK